MHLSVCVYCGSRPGTLADYAGLRAPSAQKSAAWAGNWCMAAAEPG